MTEFCGIPLASLRDNSITELDLRRKGVGVPGAIVLSKLLPSAAALKSLKCACGPKAFAFLSAPADTKANTLGVAAHLRLVMSVSLRMAASAVAPSALMLLPVRLRARGRMGTVRE
eukprot:scaffold6811_cov55-Phaeocystis_antarctica.AAC.3